MKVEIGNSNPTSNKPSFLHRLSIMSPISPKKKMPASPLVKLQTDEMKKLKNKISNFPAGKKKSLKSVNSKSSCFNGKIKDGTPNYLWIIFFVKKFISILKISVLIKKLAKMKNYHYNIIGDKSYFTPDINFFYSMIKDNNPLFHDEKQTSKIQKFKEKIGKFWKFIVLLLSRIEVFQSDKIFISVWNLIMLSFVLLNALYLPLKIGFEIDEKKINIFIKTIFESIPVWIFIIDIIITLNSAYYSKGSFVCDRYKILKHYFKYSLLLDIITIGPYLLGYFSDIGYVEMLFLMRIFKLKALIKKFEEFLQIRDLYGARFQLAKLMGFIFYMAHLCCCAWHFLALVEISNGETYTWLDSLKIRGDSWEIKYVNSLYYSIVTMVTVGYGDITPQNTLEKIFSICYIGMACGIFAYGVSEVGNILKEMNKREDDFKFTK